jgi:hypothetical protein
MAAVGVQLHRKAFSLDATQESREVFLERGFPSGDDDSIQKALTLPDKIKKAVLIQEGFSRVIHQVRIVAVGATEIATRDETHTAHFAGKVNERGFLQTADNHIPFASK